MVMISVGGRRSLRPSGYARRAQELRVRLRAEHVLLHPREERVAVARDRVPRLAEGVVAVVVAVRVARDARRWAPRTPRRAPSAAGSTRSSAPARSSTISSTVTIAACAASTASFWMPTMPLISTLPLRSALLRVDHRDVGIDRRRGGELLAGEGAGDGADVRVVLRQVASRRSRAAPRRAGPRRPPGSGPPCRRGCAPGSRAACGQPFSIASRKRWIEPTPGFPPHENTRPARSPCRSSGRR